MEIVKFGTLLKNGEPHVGCVEKANDAKLGFGDTIPDMEFEWVEASNLLVARHLVCTGISWDALNAQKLIVGQPVRIDGRYFMCRCPSERDPIYDIHDESNNAWGDWDECFWCQEEHPDNPTFRVLRKMSKQETFYGTKDAAVARIGFRPVLEPVKLAGGPVENLYHAMHENVKLWFPFGPVECPIEGTLIECSDYDVTIQTKQRLKLEEKQPYIYQDGDEIIINRYILTWMTEK